MNRRTRVSRTAWIWTCTASVSAIALGASSGANAQETAEVELRAGAVAATNPFLTAGEDPQSVALSVEVLPTMTWNDEVSTLTLNGRLRYEEWLDKYDSDLSGQVGLAVTRQASETLEIFGSASFESIERSSPDLLVSSIEDGEDLPLIDPGLEPLDPTLSVGGVRRQSAVATAGFRKQVSAVSQINATLSSAMNWFNEGGVDYRSSELSLGYQRAIAPNLTFLSEVRGTKSDYLDQARGDGTFGTALAGLSAQVSPTGVLTATAGIAIASVDTGFGENQQGEFFVMAADYCEELLQGRLCLGGSRESRPTTIGGASTLTAVDVGWNRAFDRGENISFNLRYSDAKASLAAFDTDNVQRTKFLGASAYYVYPISDRLGVFASPSAIKLFDDPSDRDANYQVMIGLSYVFGR